MDIQTLKNRLTGSATNKIWAPELRILGDNRDVPMAGLHDLCYDAKNRTLTFRAAWLLEYVAVHHPGRFLGVADTFLTRLPEQRNFSCQRHFTKILMVMTHGKASKLYTDAYSRINRESLVETVFGWLIDPRTPVAVQVNCMDVLLNISWELPWIRDELKQQTEFLLRDGSAALQSRGKKVLGKLARVRNGG